MLIKKLKKIIMKYGHILDSFNDLEITMTEGDYRNPVCYDRICQSFGFAS